MEVNLAMSLTRSTKVKLMVALVADGQLQLTTSRPG